MRLVEAKGQGCRGLAGARQGKGARLAGPTRASSCEEGRSGEPTPRSQRGTKVPPGASTGAAACSPSRRSLGHAGGYGDRRARRASPSSTADGRSGWRACEEPRGARAVDRKARAGPTLRRERDPRAWGELVGLAGASKLARPRCERSAETPCPPAITRSACAAGRPATNALRPVLCFARCRDAECS